MSIAKPYTSRPKALLKFLKLISFLGFHKYIYWLKLLALWIISFLTLLQLQLSITCKPDKDSASYELTYMDYQVLC